MILITKDLKINEDKKFNFSAFDYMVKYQANQDYDLNIGNVELSYLNNEDTIEYIINETFKLLDAYYKSKLSIESIERRERWEYMSKVYAYQLFKKSLYYLKLKIFDFYYQYEDPNKKDNPIPDVKYDKIKEYSDMINSVFQRRLVKSPTHKGGGNKNMLSGGDPKTSPTNTNIIKLIGKDFLDSGDLFDKGSKLINKLKEEFKDINTLVEAIDKKNTNEEISELSYLVNTSTTKPSRLRFMSILRDVNINLNKGFNIDWPFADVDIFRYLSDSDKYDTLDEYLDKFKDEIKEGLVTNHKQIGFDKTMVDAMRKMKELLDNLDSFTSCIESQFNFTFIYIDNLDEVLTAINDSTFIIITNKLRLNSDIIEHIKFIQELLINWDFLINSN